MSSLVDMIIATLRPMLADFKVEIDRENKKLKIYQKLNEIEFTYEQFVEKIAEIVNGTQ